MRIDQFMNLIEEELLPNIQLKSEQPYNPLYVKNRSLSWKTIGIGNYAGVFTHHAKPNWVVKVYGRSPEDINKEIDVYKKIGIHERFSNLIAYDENYLILKKIDGITLFEALVKGVPIPRKVLEDVDDGLDYAKSVGLNPYDVHGKNVVMSGGRGFIIDVSDFYKEGYCCKWDDFKKAYQGIYQPFMLKHHPPLPYYIVDGIRKCYRLYRKYRKGSK